MSTFHYSGKLNNFDKIIYLGNVVAGYLAPMLFLHFCFVFPEPQKWIRRRGAAVLVYLPGLALLARPVWDSIRIADAPARRCSRLRWLLDRVWLVFLCAMYVAGGVGARVPVAACGRSHRAAPVDLAAQWRAGRHSAVRADLRGAVCVRRGSESRHEPGGAVAAADPADLGVCDSALPADGRRHHFPGRLRLHAGDAGGAGDFLRPDFLGHQRRQHHQRHGDGRADPDRGVRVPADSQLDSGAARPVLLL